jgi:hypothetical protein
MSAALAGATQWASSRARANPSEKVAVVFLTDGEPNGCDPDPAHMAALSEEAWASAGVSTYTVGIPGANLSLLDPIAASGQSGSALVIASGDGGRSLLSALDAIRRSQLDCELPIPADPGPAQVLDLDTLTVAYQVAGGGQSQPLARRSSVADCDATGGYYLDLASSPGLVRLCPSSCEEVAALSAATHDLSFGCSTVPQ